ncbi:acyltransferase family protein [Phenylobacterium kunshanense]|nr:acyltransferase family protein [Phenylobacterium kunshanense]
MTLATPRRHDLDALRVAAFLLLILYHLGMFYVPWGWHVKSDHLVPQLEPWMGAINPWRLTLLFVISGAATRFMAVRMPAPVLAAQRTQRLLIPLAFGILVVVAPQSWAEVVEKNGYAGSFLDFWPRYLGFDQSFGIILPTYNHLWFVAYLWLYTMLAIATRPLWERLDWLAARILKGPGLLLVPPALFGLYLATAGRTWGETHVVWADAYGHLQYGSAFLLGLLLARMDAAWGLFQRLRTGLALTAVVLLATGLALKDVETGGGPGAIGFAFLREGYAWTTICALFGYARRYIRSGSPILSTLTEAVFPFYIIHQTTIVVAGHLLKRLELSLTVEAVTILALTIGSCWATYAIARAVPMLRLPLGLKPLPRPSANQPAAVG